ncbi:hypothetical protein QQM79_09990 [Marinobacteraceae bacterium S3BR75-40.1]
MTRSLKPLLLTLLTLWAGALYAATPETVRSDFREGVAAFNAENYDLARKKLEAARDGGLQSAALFYNLGVVYFRLELYLQARQAFGRLLGGSNALLAHYNLGLVALAADQPQQARQHFAKVAASSKPKLATLARRQLQQLDVDQTPETQPQPVALYLSLAGGYENNLSLEQDGSTAETSGAAMEAVLAASGYLWGARDAGIRLSGSHFNLRYPSHSDFDRHVTQATLSADRRFGRRWWTRGSIGQLWLYEDGERAERHTPVAVAATAEACGPLSRGRYCRLKLEHARVTADADYAGYDGYREAVRAELAAGSSAWPWTLEYRLVNDERDDLALGDEFYSYSAWRHRLRGELRHEVNPRLSIGVNLGLQLSRYKDDHRLFRDAVLVNERRRDRRYGAGVDVRYRWRGDWQLFAEGQVRHNSSTLDRYDYDNSSLLLGIERQW